jgi:transcriptional regulator with XRE-family HTH domain
VSIGKRILLGLTQSGKNQIDLARYLSTKPSTVTGWIKAGRIPSAASIMPICEFTGVSVSWLLTGEGEMFIGEKSEVSSCNTTTSGQGIAVSGSGNTVNSPTLTQTNSLPLQSEESASMMLEGNKNGNFKVVLPAGEKTDDIMSIITTVMAGPLWGVAVRLFLQWLNPESKLWYWIDLGIKRRNLTQPRQPDLEFQMEWWKSAIFASKEDLQKIWANLALNAQDPNFDKSKVRTAYVYVANNLSVLDYNALKLLQKLTASNEHYYFPLDKNSLHFEQYKNDLGPDAEKIAVSIENLVRLRLINTTQIVKTPKAQWGKLEFQPSYKFSSFSDEADIRDLGVKTEDTLAPGYAHFTTFGLEFLEACGDG